MKALISYFKNIRIDILFLGLAFVFVFLNSNKYLLVSANCVFQVLCLVCSYVFILKKGKLTVNKNILYSFVFLGVLMVSVANAGTAISRGVFLSFLLMILLYVGVITLPITKDEIQYLFWCIIVGTLIISILVLLFRVDYYGSGGLRFTIKIGDNDAVDPNYLGAYLSMGVSIASGYFICGRKKVFCGIVSLILIAATLLTGSRGAMLAVAVSVVFTGIHYLFSKNDKKLFFRVIICCIIVVFLLYLLVTFLPDNIFKRFFINSYSDSSNDRRWYLWSNALTAIKASWFLGNGCIEEADIVAKYCGVYEPAHNTYLGIWMQLGIIGLLTVICLWVKQIIEALKNKNFILVGMILNVCLSSFIIGASYSMTFWGTLMISTLINGYYKKEHLSRGEIYEF